MTAESRALTTLERGQELRSATNPVRLFHVIPSLDVGGVQTRIVDIVNGLAGFEHTFLALDGRYDALARLAPHVVKTKVYAVDSGLSLPARLSVYARTISQHHPHVLLSYNWGSIEFALANLWLGYPHIHSEDGFGPEESTGQLRRRIWIRRLALRRSTVVVPAVNLERLARASWWISEDHLRRIPNGIDLAVFVPAPKSAARSKLNLPTDALIVGWVGALRREKNVARLLRAFANLGAKDARLVVVGDGPERENLKQTAAALQIADRVVWLGSRNDIAAVLPAFDVFALSSDTEQMPIVVMEAMASGLPIASIDAGDISQMVATPNAPFIVAQHDDVLTAALHQLAADQDLRDQIGKANRKRAIELFDRRRMLAAYQTLYRGHVGLSPPPGA